MAYIYPVQRNSSLIYRVYYWYKSKKIYIGLYKTFEQAQEAYDYVDYLFNSTVGVTDYTSSVLSFKKYITLINFRHTGKYIQSPILIFDTYFYYYMNEDLYLIFDLRDLLFFSTYKIVKRKNYLFTVVGNHSESILTRFGILPHSALGKDYRFKNGNRYDFRRENLEVINHYKGIRYEQKYNRLVYVTRIFTDRHIIVGHYDSELIAAIAYNKAIDQALSTGLKCCDIKNEFPYLTRSEYQHLYDSLTISKRLYNPSRQHRVMSRNLYRGVSKDGSGFRASIGFNTKQIYLGIYTTPERAAQAYNFASLYLYGPKGYTNDVSPLTYNGDEQKIASKLACASALKHQH